MQKPVSDFPIVSSNDDNCTLNLGMFSFQGEDYRLELEAFSNDGGDTYDFHNADIVLDGLNMTRWHNSEELRAALEAYLRALIEGETNLTWATNGTQCYYILSFGRNG